MAVSVLEVLITGDSTKLTGALAQGTLSAKSFEKSVGGVATSAKSALGTVVPLGAAAAGLAVAAFAKQSIDAAVAFDQSFTQIAALTNTTDDALVGMKQSVLDLAGQTAQSPVELAHAAYFLASAGLDAAQQMQTLEAAAKGSAVGLGDAGDIARITANALNVFADNGLTATKAVDTLAAAVREGSAEPDEFAGALGRVLPIADKAGISFEQVAASLATMSNAGLDVNEGVTALRGTLQSLVAPTKQTEDALASIGLTVDDVVSSLQQQGLIATLRMLDEAARKNTDSTGQYNIVMRELIPNVRALTGVFNLTSQQAEKVDEIFRSVVDSSGALDEAFRTTQQSASFKLHQALNQLAIDGQELATKVLPTLASGMQLAADHAEVLFRVLVGYAALKFVAPLLRGITVESEALAAAQLVPLRPDVAASWGQQLSRLNIIAQENTATVTKTSGATRLLNSSLGETIPLVLAFSAAWDDVNHAMSAVQANDIVGVVTTIRDTMQQFSTPLLAFDQDFTGPSFDTTEIGHFEDVLNVLHTQLITTGLTAEQQSKVISDAMAAVGGSLDPSNVEDFAHAFQDSLSAVQAQAAADEEAAKQAKELAASQQQAAMQTQGWQQNMDRLTGKLHGLAALGIDVTSFIDELGSKLAESDDPAKDFAAALGDVAKAWTEFQSQTADALNFAPSALSDLTSAAEGASQQLASIEPPSKDLNPHELAAYNDELANLQATAHLTGEEILQSFRDAAQQTKVFGRDLLEISRVGGQAGKDLAQSLLESGNVLAAQVIADSSGKLQRQIVGAFGKGEDAADSFSTKLTNAIVGPLKNIQSILVVVASELTGLPKSTFINIRTNAAAARNEVVNLGHSIKDLPVSTVLDIKLHTGPSSPWPDEALKTHLTDPLSRAGFTRIGDRYTLPLDVTAHSAFDPITPPGARDGSSGGSLKHLTQIEADSRGYLKDIRGLLHHGGGLGDAGSGSGGVSGSVGPGGTSASLSSSLDDAVHRVVKLAGKSGLSDKDAIGVIRHVGQEGTDAAFIKRSVAQVADELGKHTAALYGRALRKLDDATLHSDAKRAALIRSALEAQDALKQKQADRVPFWWMDYAQKNIPKMPEHHFAVDPNIHRRDERRAVPIQVHLSRPHMDRELAYESDYRGW